MTYIYERGFDDGREMPDLTYSERFTDFVFYHVKGIGYTFKEDNSNCLSLFSPFTVFPHYENKPI